MARQSDIDAGDQYHPRAGHRRGRASGMASGRRATGGSELAVAFATGMCTPPNLASAISATPLADFGIILITSAEPPRRLWLPPTATNSLNIARAAVGRIAIDRTKLTVGSREFEMAWLVRRSFVQGGHPTLPLCTRYFESDERGTYL
jgi:hypothetical protein